MDKTKFKRYYTETYYQYRLDFITSMIGSFKEYIKPLFVSDDTDQILLDFLNYMIRICDYDDTYSRFDLALEAKEELRAEELEKLKDFLLSTEKYGIGLSKGKTLSDLYSKIERSRAKHSKKLSELEALAYAYAKSTECPVESIPESGINDIDNLVVYMKSH